MFRIYAERVIYYAAFTVEESELSQFACKLTNILYEVFMPSVRIIKFK